MGSYYVYRHWINRDYHPLFPTKNQYDRQPWGMFESHTLYGEGCRLRDSRFGACRGRLDCYRSIENAPMKENPENGKLHGTWGR